MTLNFRLAVPNDVPALNELVNAGYRGDASRAGWTTEADLLEGVRTDEPEIRAMLGEEDSVFLLAFDDDELVGSVNLRHEGMRAYLGMLVVRPVRQASGLGSRLIEEAERFVRERWAVTTMRMTVLGQRAELIGFYERRGYRRTGERIPWPKDAKSTPKVADLAFEELAKSL